jgi:signal transduction histidine kinase
MLINKKGLSAKEIDSAAIAHELRNPLNNITLSCGQLKEEIGSLGLSDGQLIIYLDIIERNCQRLNSLIQDMFRHENGQCHPSSKNVNAVLEESLALAADRINLKGIKLEKYYLAGDSSFHTDPNRLKLAFLNIIINAVESMDAGKGILRIFTLEEEDKLVIKFCDNGTGISEEEIPKLFNPDFSKKKGGLGMGLAITREVLQRSNACIDVKSKLGEGSVFSISFKVTPEDEVAEN